MQKILQLLSLLALLQTALAAPPDASGKWKWVYERNGEPLDIEMNLDQQGSKLTGKVLAPEDRRMEVHDGKITDEGMLTFYINLERDNGPLKINFQGKLNGDRIDGKVAFLTDDGEKREHEWNPKRAAAHNLTGKWNSVFKRSDGTPMETTLELKQTGQKLTGNQSFNDNETEIRDGKVEGDQVTFRTERERDGRTVTAKYKGKIQKDGTIKGDIASDWTGEVRHLEWEARKTK